MKKTPKAKHMAKEGRRSAKSNSWEAQKMTRSARRALNAAVRELEKASIEDLDDVASSGATAKLEALDQAKCWGNWKYGLGGGVRRWAKVVVENAEAPEEQRAKLTPQLKRDADWVTRGDLRWLSMPATHFGLRPSFVKRTREEGEAIFRESVATSLANLAKLLTDFDELGIVSDIPFLRCAYPEGSLGPSLYEHRHEACPFLPNVKMCIIQAKDGRPRYQVPIYNQKRFCCAPSVSDIQSFFAIDVHALPLKSVAQVKTLASMFVEILAQTVSASHNPSLKEKLTAESRRFLHLHL